MGGHDGQDGVQSPRAGPREQGWGVGASRLMRGRGQACALAYHAGERTAALQAVSLVWRYWAEGSPLPRAPGQPGPVRLFPQERLEAARQASSEARKQSSSLGEQLQTLRGELADLELQRAEAEGRRQQLQEVRARGAPLASTSSQGRTPPPGGSAAPSSCPRYLLRCRTEAPGLFLAAGLLIATSLAWAG